MLKYQREMTDIGTCVYQQGVFVIMQNDVAFKGELLQIKVRSQEQTKGGCNNLSCTESLSKPLPGAAVPNLPLNPLLWLCLIEICLRLLKPLLKVTQSSCFILL